jgi:hypothetical protein
MYMDIFDGAAGPRRGDILASPRSRYWVLHSRRVKRHDAAAPPRYQMRVIRSEEVSEELRAKLFRSAQRRDGTHVYTFTWYKREKKKRSFENHMRRGVHGD